MSNYNKYANTFKGATANEEYQEYIKSDGASAPNLAYIQTGDTAGNIVIEKYVASDHMIFGTTTGTTDFYIGASATYKTSSASNGIHCHIINTGTGINYFYADSSDVVGNIVCFNNNTSGFKNKGVKSIMKWAYNNQNLTNIDYMFDGNPVTYIDFSNFKTPNLTSLSSIFQNCSSLKVLDLRGFDTTKVNNISMFNKYNGIEKLYLSSSFFNSSSNYYGFGILSKWTDPDSLAMFVTAITSHDGTGKTVSLSTETQAALTQAQKDLITGAGWTIIS